jgi:hypothetical protein
VKPTRTRDAAERERERAHLAAMEKREREAIAAWLDSARLVSYYQGEPTRALLFTTRTEARSFCDVQHAKYIGRTDCCARWRFRPVRVRETVKVVP